ncbi:MAG: N-acetylmuramoyl-L-alanine amidase [Clostridiales bacterium]|nr:N-acetylmuramoyl-L-alanine amidase [Clostridiales bacterium]
MRINVHAGHNPDGKVACGAIGLIKESTEARRVKDEVICQLRQLGHTVYDCTEDNGSGQSNVLKRIIEKCNAHEVDLDLSIHFNAGAGDGTGNGKTTGTEAFLYSANSKAKPYAQNIVRAIGDLGFRIRDDSVKDDVKTTTSLYYLGNTKAPALLLECCFVDDKDDVQLYDSTSMASAIVYGITGQRVQEDPSEPEEVVEDPKTMYRVQVGAYGVKSNAVKMRDKLREAGFDAILVKA